MPVFFAVCEKLSRLVEKYAHIVPWKPDRVSVGLSDEQKIEATLSYDILSGTDVCPSSEGFGSEAACIAMSWSLSILQVESSMKETSDYGRRAS